MNRPRFWLIVCLIAIPAALRLVDHPWNLAPMGALALFAGAHMRNRALAFLVPMVAMFVSDLGLGLLRNDLGFYTFHALLPVIYVCYALNVLLGMGIRRTWSRQSGGAVDGAGEGSRRGVPVWARAMPVAGGALAGSLLFFVISNFAHWALTPNYPRTFEGLVYCFDMAIPFFRATVVSDVVYCVVLFGGFAILSQHVPAFKESGLLGTE